MKYIKHIPILLMMCALLATPMFGNKPVLIVSGSMEPAIKTGAMTIVNFCGFDDFKVGDICTYWSPDFNEYITHRVVLIGEDYLVTQGDVNTVVDPTPVINDMIMGKVILTLNFVAPAFQRYIGDHTFDRGAFMADASTATICLIILIYIGFYLFNMLHGAFDMFRGEVTTPLGDAALDYALSAPCYVEDKKYPFLKRLRVYLSYCAFVHAAKDVSDELEKLRKDG